MVTIMCIAAANKIIELTNAYNKEHPERQIVMTGKRLQKLLYFSEIQYMKSNSGNPMLTDEFYAWPSGPVIPAVYDRFMMYQNGVMHPILGGNHTPLDENMEAAIQIVFEQTCELDTYDLVLLSHVKDGPWASVYVDDGHYEQPVSKQVMYKFYANREIFKIDS